MYAYFRTQSRKRSELEYIAKYGIQGNSYAVGGLGVLLESSLENASAGIHKGSVLAVEVGKTTPIPGAKTVVSDIALIDPTNIYCHTGSRWLKVGTFVDQPSIQQRHDSFPRLDRGPSSSTAEWVKRYHQFATTHYVETSLNDQHETSKIVYQSAKDGKQRFVDFGTRLQAVNLDDSEVLRDFIALAIEKYAIGKRVHIADGHAEWQDLVMAELSRQGHAPSNSKLQDRFIEVEASVKAGTFGMKRVSLEIDQSTTKGDRGPASRRKTIDRDEGRFSGGY
jgi:hypothetical protein